MARLTLIRLLLLWQLALAGAWADIVHLKNGKTLQGEVVSEDDDFVVLKVPCGEIKLRQRDIEAIERQTPLDYRLDLGRRSMQQQNFERAVSALEDACRLDRKSAEAPRLLATAYELQARHYAALHRYVEAKEVLEKLLKLDPQAELAPHRAGRSLQEIEKQEKDVSAQLGNARQLAAAEEWSKAIAAYESVLNFTPDARAAVAPALAQCYAKRALEHGREGRALNAAADIEAALRLDPALADRVERLYVSCALPGILASIEHGDAASAQVDLKRVLSFAPTDRQVLYVSGRLNEALGKIPAAAADYARALRDRVGNPTPEFTAKLRARLEEELGIKNSKWRIEVDAPEIVTDTRLADGAPRKLETENFTIFHFSDTVAQQVAESAEYHRSRVLNDLGFKECWKGKAKIYVHRTQAEYTSKTGQPDWTGGCSKVVLDGDKVFNPQIHSWQNSPRLLKSVLPHEITHLLLNCNLADAQALPKCLHEGFAVLMEPKFRQDYFMNFLRMRLKSQNFIGLSDLMVANDYPKEPEFFYAEGYGILQYLISLKDTATVAKALSQARSAAKVQEELLRIAGVKTLDDLEARWKNWVLDGEKKK